MSILNLPAYLRQPIHLAVDTTSLDPSHHFSRLQIDFVEHARGLLLQKSPQEVLGPPEIDSRLLIEEDDIIAGGANDIQTWIKQFLSQFNTSLPDRLASAQILLWYMRVS